jgi:hypothetical protein
VYVHHSGCRPVSPDLAGALLLTPFLSVLRPTLLPSKPMDFLAASIGAIIALWLVGHERLATLGAEFRTPRTRAHCCDGTLEVVDGLNLDAAYRGGQFHADLWL